MTDGEKVIAAYECSNEKMPDKRCEKCPFGYAYLDQTGDNYVVGCNTERMMVDAIDLLRAQEPVEPIKPDEDNMVYCGACGAPVGYEVLEPPGMDYIRYNYCQNCGIKVKWK